MNRLGVGIAVVYVVLGAGVLPAQIVMPRCVDVRGREVMVFANAALADVAMLRAGPDSGAPRIEYNASIMRTFAPGTQLFFFLHECAHVQMGHLDSARYVTHLSEQDADCWAANRIRSDSTLSRGINLFHFMADIRRQPADSAHPSGSVRLNRILSCWFGDEVLKLR